PRTPPSMPLALILLLINGERMNKDGMTLRVTVLNGMHEGKFTDLTFNDGSPDDKDGGAFLDKRQAGMLLAANVLSVSDLNGDEISYDEQIARGSQALVKFKTREYEKNGETKTSFDVDGLHFYHVDDPRAKDYPRNTSKLELIPAKHRHDASYFEPIIGKGRGAKTARSKAAAESEYDDI
ncbi:MAG: hypothetical protein AAFN70_06685, partial [Planctomycetota bacterium]